MRAVLGRAFEVESTYGVMRNAYKMYDRTRELASATSCERAKQLERDGVPVHPILARAVPTAELQRAEVVAAIAAYRPGLTVFEMEGSTSVGADLAMIARKRKRHDKVTRTHARTHTHTHTQTHTHTSLVLTPPPPHHHHHTHTPLSSR
jgi:hypothetical protein